MRDLMLIIHFIGLAMGLGTSIGFMFLGMAGAKMEPEESKDFRFKTAALSKMGQFGLVFLLVSGMYLITPYWSSLGDMPLLVVKLVLFVALGALIGIIGSTMKKAMKGDTEKHFKTMEGLGKISLLVALAIVVLAV
ncbi:MAG: hypothetical protein H6605_10645, partial [Flavobacteriales bacterium]|nr:hypothetical protein [Flavobacteriales bacterium]